MDPDGVFAPEPEMMQRAVARLVTLRAEPGHPRPATSVAELPETLPATGIGADDALALATTLGVGGAARLDHRGYLAHMDPPTPWPTWIATAVAASVNQNLLHPDAAPVVRGLEQRVVAWLAPLFGKDGGHLVPGSSLANLTALWAARDLAGAQEVVASSVAHLSVRKAAHLLGMTFREVDVDDRQMIRGEQLGDLSRAALVLTAGTVAAGAIDPLHLGRGAAWRHVDAAWAGPLRLSDRYGQMLDGIEEADSVAVSAHKWLYQPKESALVLFADSCAAHEAVSFGGSYLAEPNVGLLGSHGAAAALSLLTTLLVFGRAGLAELIDGDMATADRLCALADADDRLELRASHITGVVNWRVAGKDPADIQKHLDGAWVSTAVVNGESWLRSVAVNPLADPDHVVDAVLRSAARLAR